MNTRRYTYILRSCRSFPVGATLLSLFLSFFVCPARAQLATTEDASAAYYDAVSRLLTRGQASGLEIFLEDHPNTQFSKDALELLLYAYAQGNCSGKAVLAAHQLLLMDADDVPALAFLAEYEEQFGRTSSRPDQNMKNARAFANHGVLTLSTFTAPHGLNEDQAEDLKRRVTATLEGVFGFLELRSKNYATAQNHLRAAVRAAPDNIDHVYSLALSYLLAKPPNNKDGLWFLARAANLVSGTPFGDKIRDYGLRRSRAVAGSEKAWDRLLTETRFASLPEVPQAAAATAPATVSDFKLPVSDVSPDPTLESSTDVPNASGQTVELRIRASLVDTNSLRHAVARMDVAVRPLDGNRAAQSTILVTDDLGVARMKVPPGRYAIETPHGAYLAGKWLTWDLELPATEAQNSVELNNQNATTVSTANDLSTESLSEDHKPSSPKAAESKSPPAFPVNLLSGASNPSPCISGKSLKDYDKVLVKKFAVEKSKETASFPGGDEEVLQRLIIGRLRQQTSFRQVIDGSEPLPANDGSRSNSSGEVTLSGIILEYSNKGQIRRGVIGFTGGGTRIRIHFVFRDAQTGEEVFSTELTAAGSPSLLGASADQTGSQAIFHIASLLIKETNTNR